MLPPTWGMAWPIVRSASDVPDDQCSLRKSYFADRNRNPLYGNDPTLVIGEVCSCRTHALNPKVTLLGPPSTGRSTFRGVRAIPWFFRRPCSWPDNTLLGTDSRP